MTLQELIARKRTQIAALMTERAANVTALAELRTAETPTEADEARIEELRQRNASIDIEARDTEAAIANLEAELASDQAATARSAVTTPAAPSPSQNRAPAVVTSEARTYSAESDPNGELFLRDVVADFLGTRGPHRERLSRHEQEERVERGEEQLTRGVTAAGAPGLVVPQYLVDLYAAKGRPGRKFADQCRHHDLPETGMTVYIPRQTAKTSVDIQAAELDTVAENDYDDELISVAVRTAAGSQTISRQAAERSLGTLDIVFDDLMRSYDSDLDNKLINSATWGLLAVANAITFTSGSPTAELLYNKIVAAQANAEDVLLDADEDDFFTLMRGRRWAWMKNALTDKWPFIAAQGFGGNSVGTNTDGGYRDGVRGYLPDGGAVVTDNNLPSNLGTGTNEDVAVVVARHEAHLWEDPAAPVFIRAEQGPSLKKLGLDLVVYGYFAGCFDRVVDAQGSPKAVHQKITGTGLVAPTF